MPSLQRALGLFDTFGLVIGAVVGAGIYAVTGVASRAAGPSLILSVLAAGAVAALTAISITQLSAAFPREGGEYEFGYKTISPFAGFLSGWIWNINKVLADAAVALAFATYLSVFLPVVPAQPVAVAVIALVTLINYAGVKTAGKVVDLLSIATLAILFLFVLGGSFFIRPANFQPFAPHGAVGMLRAAAVMFFAYVGFSRPIYLVEEIKNPARNVPLGIFLGLAVSTVFYLLVTFVAVGLGGSAATGSAGVAGSPAPSATWFVVSGLGVSRLSCRLRSMSPIGSKLAASLTALVISSACFLRSAISASRKASWNWPWNSFAMRLILPIHWPSERNTVGSSFGPIAISATMPMMTSLPQSSSNMD